MKATPVLKRLAVAAAAVCWLSIASVRADVTNDREYTFGEDSLEGASQGATIGSSNTAPLQSGNTADGKGPSGAFLDLTQNGGPTYQDVGPGGLARPGAASGEFGARFNGTSTLLRGIPLNRPDALEAAVNATNPSTPFPLNYDNLLGHGLQMWVYPDAAGLGSAGAPTTFQSIVADTTSSGGPAINAQGQWTQINSGHLDNNDIPATVDVAAGDAWYHVMHHHTPISGDTFKSVVYVDGVAVSANQDTIVAAPPENFVGALVVGARETANDGVTPTFGNYFDGVVDNLEMYVYGDNSSSGGMNWGDFDLFADNAWIAQEIADTVPGGTLTPGDVNKDGSVSGDGSGPASSDDVSAFIAGWRSENTFQGAHGEVTAGDWLSWDNGDLNHDGVTNYSDWFILRGNHPNGAALNLSTLLGSAVPEPTTGALLLLGAAGLAGRRRRSASNVG